MNIYKQFIIIIIAFSMIISVESNFRNSYSRMYAKNNKRSIINACNRIALNQTNEIEIYNCLNENNNCENLNNYEEFIIIRNNCIKEMNNTQGMILLIIIILWALLSIPCC